MLLSHSVYAGVINRQVVFCCHPVVVVGKRGVAASFTSVDDALRFLMARGFGTGALFRHNGSDWDRVEVDPLQVLEQAAREARN